MGQEPNLQSQAPGINPVFLLPVARAFATDFMPDPARPCFLAYSIIVTIPAGAGDQYASVNLLADPGLATPTTIRQNVRVRIAAQATQQEIKVPMVWLAPPGYTVRLNSQIITGAPVVALVQASEIHL